jgi:hypothetical protein
MSLVTLVHPGETFTVTAQNLVSQCGLFNTRASLLTAPYTVRSPVPLHLFRDFVAALAGKPLEINRENVSGLSLLCAEFGFRSLAGKVAGFRASPAFLAVKPAEDCQARLRIASLEERSQELDSEIAALRSVVSVAHKSTDEALSAAVDRVSRLEAEVSALKDSQSGLATMTMVSAVVADLRAELRTAEAKFTRLSSEVAERQENGVSAPLANPPKAVSRQPMPRVQPPWSILRLSKS